MTDQFGNHTLSFDQEEGETYKQKDRRIWQVFLETVPEEEEKQEKKEKKAWYAVSSVTGISEDLKLADNSTVEERENVWKRIVYSQPRKIE